MLIMREIKLFHAPVYVTNNVTYTGTDSTKAKIDMAGSIINYLIIYFSNSMDICIEPTEI